MNISLLKKKGIRQLKINDDFTYEYSGFILFRGQSNAATIKDYNLTKLGTRRCTI